jgi:hypothetical protein
MPVQFSDDEFYEVNDAIGEVVHRMVHAGQTDSEINHQSLARLWSAFDKLSAERFGTSDTPGRQSMVDAVREAIDNPKRLGVDDAKLLHQRH